MANRFVHGPKFLRKQPTWCDFLPTFLARYPSSRIRIEICARNVYDGSDRTLPLSKWIEKSRATSPFATPDGKILVLNSWLLIPQFSCYLPWYVFLQFEHYRVRKIVLQRRSLSPYMERLAP